MRFALRALMLVLSAWALGTLARAEAQERVLRLPAATQGVRSLEVLDPDSPVFRAAGEGTQRRGTLAKGTRVVPVRRVSAGGCGGPRRGETGWWEIRDPTGRGPRFVCAKRVEPSTDAPAGLPQPDMRDADAAGRLLPHDYAFVAFDGARAFAHPEDYFSDQYEEAFGVGFGLIVGRSTTARGVRFLRTRRGLWIDADSLRFARGAGWTGLSEPTLPLGFARRGAQVQRSRRGGVIRRPGLRETIPLAAVDGAWASVAEGGAIRSRSLHLAVPMEPPPEAGPEGTWIDVDVSEQTLVFYRGRTPLFATLVSTGRGGANRETPLGTHRIWVKLAFSDMTDLEREVERNYALERVPWVQYFEGANGLHAAFWHDEFGRRRSHGCVNLSPRDARQIFDLTEPALPPGWTALFPEEGEPTTFVRVRR